MKGLITPEIADSPIGRLQGRAGRHRAARGRRRGRASCAASPSTSASSTPPRRSTSRPPARASTTRTSSTSASARSPPRYGDLAEVTAKQSGSTASQVGDEVVTLNRDDTHGVEARFTLEMKNRRSTCARRWPSSTRRSCNRDALRRDRGVPLAGAGADRRCRSSTTTTRRSWCSTPTTATTRRCVSPTCGRAGRCASGWRSSDEQAEFDLERVRCLLDDASRALERHAAIKRSHTAARKSIDQAADQVEALVFESRQALDELETELQG